MMKDHWPTDEEEYVLEIGVHSALAEGNAAGKVQECVYLNLREFSLRAQSHDAGVGGVNREVVGIPGKRTNREGIRINQPPC